MDGSELVGREAAPWTFSDWSNSEPLTLESLKGRVVVVRFWTAPDCPFCKKSWKVTFPIAHDRGWKTLKAWWLVTGYRHATSVTFVVGPDGKILHVHPGPVFHPSDDPEEAKQNRDYLAVVASIKQGIAAASM